MTITAEQRSLLLYGRLPLTSATEQISRINSIAVPIGAAGWRSSTGGNQTFVDNSRGFVWLMIGVVEASLLTLNWLLRSFHSRTP